MVETNCHKVGLGSSKMILQDAKLISMIHVFTEYNINTDHQNKCTPVFNFRTYRDVTVINIDLYTVTWYCDISSVDRLIYFNLLSYKY